MTDATAGVTPFQWNFVERPLITKVTIDGVENIAALQAYLVHEKTPNIVYVKLPFLFQDYVIRLQDLLDRVDDKTFQGALFPDFDHDWNIQCTFWTMNGRAVGPEALRNSRLGRSLYGNRPEYYKSYRDQWVSCFNYAIRIVGIQKSESATTEFLRRFYEPPSDKPFPLYFVPGRCLENFSRNNLKEALTLASKNAAGIVPEWLPSHRITSEYIQLSINPLGLYSTWVKRQDFARLVDDQTAGKHWTRVLPNAQQVTEFDKKLGSKSETEGVLDFDSVGTHSRSSLLQWPGQNLRSFETRSKSIAMAELADKWSTDTLKWHNKEGSTGAEWLNLVGHRLDESSGNRFTNMLFGTKECNTTMMRAEAAVTQLLFSGRTYAVKVETEIKHALKQVRMLDVPELYSSIAEVSWLKHKPGEPELNSYPDWLAPELKYTITSYLPTKDGYIEESSSTLFHPFSRQNPFRYEYELDKVVLEMYLDHFEVPVDVDPIRALVNIIRKGHSTPDAYYFDSVRGDGSNSSDGKSVQPGDAKEAAKPGTSQVPIGDGKTTAGSKDALLSQEAGKTATGNKPSHVNTGLLAAKWKLLAANPERKRTI
ncbi:hypothetical protein FRC09_008907 [Ceratobasidium sp. 395]|nr:hypothetical protein FRC09_008907 [Ceratobasidium sp. 395]